MEMSTSISKLAGALNEAQAAYKPLKMTGENPFYSSKYSTSKDIYDACGEAINSFGLSVIQMPVSNEVCVGVETIIMHTSGEFIKSSFAVPVADLNPQKAGSCITYTKRYALKAVLGVPEAEGDDDGAAASEPKQSLSNRATQAYQGNGTTTMRPAGQVTDGQLKRLWAISKENNADDNMVKQFIKVNFDLDTSRKLHYKQYEQLISAVQAGELSLTNDALDLQPTGSPISNSSGTIVEEIPF